MRRFHSHLPNVLLLFGFGNALEQLPQMTDRHAERRTATIARYHVARVRVIFEYGPPYSEIKWCLMIKLFFLSRPTTEVQSHA